MDATTAVMVLLMCSGTGGDCMEIASDRTFETAAVCRAELPAAVARMNRAGRSVTGRCAPAADYRIPAWVDPVVTCSAGAGPKIEVTRMDEGSPLAEQRDMPKEPPGGCG